jgi:hypothetical protein
MKNSISCIFTEAQELGGFNQHMSGYFYHEFKNIKINKIVRQRCYTYTIARNLLSQIPQKIIIVY